LHMAFVEALLYPARKNSSRHAFLIASCLALSRFSNELFVSNRQNPFSIEALWGMLK